MSTNSELLKNDLMMAERAIYIETGLDYNMASWKTLNSIYKELNIEEDYANIILDYLNIREYDGIWSRELIIYGCVITNLFHKEKIEDSNEVNNYIVELLSPTGEYYVKSAIRVYLDGI